MYLRAVVVLALMAAKTTAGPLIPEQRHECAKTCIESGKFSYEMGKRYIYDYEAETSVSSEHSADSKYQIKAIAEIEPISKCNFVLRLKEVSLEDGFKVSDEGRQSAEEMRSALEEYVLPFSYQDGKIDHLCPNPSDQIWAVNIKRGVLTVFQNTMENFNRDHIGYETDIAGKCPVAYKVSEQNADSVIITKTKDVDNCKDRYDIASSVKTSMDVESVPLLKSTHDCEHKIKDGILQESSCKENYELRPFSATSNGKSTTAFATISLALKSEAPGTGFPKDLGDVSKRSSLTFEHSQSPVKNLGINDAKLALGELCNATKDDIRPQVPRLFSRFVNKLRNLDYDEITEVYHSLHSICSNTRNAKKIFFDATSLTSSSSAVLLMKKLIEDNEISYAEAEMWLLSLALIPKPTEEILSAAIGILDNNQITGKALLGISSLGNSYCKTQTNCKESPVIKKLSQKLLNIMGPISSKYPIPDDRKEMVILALKAIGNLGLVEPIVTSALESVQSDPSNLAIRLAGIDALRRVQCNEMPIDVMMKIFSNVEEDVELRIAAYLNLMKCPDQKIFSTIKFALYDEEVSQVGSFVWTHLTNIQESIDPWKKNISLIIGDQVLFKKFSADFRKFSRFYETSIYSDSLKTGAHIEGNVIFTPSSYLPRSAKLDLDIDIFGNRIDLFEFGGRMEGLEYLVESFFGPNGYFPEDTIKDVLKSYRNKKPYDDNKLNNITKMFNQLNPQENPQGSLYLRVFGNEIKSFNFNDFKSNIGRRDSNNLLQGLLMMLNRKKMDITNSFTFLDSCITVPTMTGFPLKLKVNGTAAVNMQMGAEAVYRDDVISMEGYLKPSASVQITGSMMVDGITSESGVVMLATGHTSTEVDGIFVLKRGELFTARVNFPREKLEILNVQTSFYTARNGIVSQRKENKDETIASNSCVGENLSKYTGMKLCTEKQYPSKMHSKSSLIDYISNPVTYKIAVVKTDPTLKTYDFDYIWRDITDESGKIPGPIGKVGHISFNTTGSAIDREMTGSFRWTYPTNTVHAVINTPLKKMELNGQFSNSDDKKGFETSVKMDGQEVLNVTCALQKEKEHNLLRIIPRFYLRIRDREVADVKGFFQYQEDNFEVDMSISHLTTTPISFTGYVGKVESANSSRHDIEVSLNTPVVSASSKVFYQLIGSSASTRCTFNYNVSSSRVETIELNAKFIDSSASQIVKKSASVQLKSTAIPSANWAITWDTHKYKGYMNNILELSHGPSQKLTLKQQHRSEGDWPYPMKASGNIEMQYPAQDVDYKINYNHVSSDILLESSMNIKYAPEGEIELKGSIQNNRHGQLMDRKILLGIKYPSAELKLAAKIQQPSVNQYTGDVKMEMWDGMWIQGLFATNKTMLGNGFGRNIQAKVITHRGESFAASVDVSSNKTKTTVNGEVTFGKTRYSAQLHHERDKTTRHLSAVVTTPLATHKGSLNIRNDATHKGAVIDLISGDMFHVTADGFVKNDHHSKQGHIMMNLDADKKPNDNIILDLKYKPAKEANEGVITVEYPKWKPISIKYGWHSYYGKKGGEYTFKRDFDVSVGKERLVAASVDLSSRTEPHKIHLEGVIHLDIPYFRFSPKISFIHDTVHEKATSRWRTDITATGGAFLLLKVTTSASAVYSNDSEHLIGNVYLTSFYNEKQPITVDFDISSKLNKLNTGVKIVLPYGKTFLLNYGINDMSTDSEKILEGNLNITTPFQLVRDISISGKMIISDRVSIQTDLAWNDLKVGTELDAKVASEKNKWSAIVHSKFSTSVPGFEEFSSSLRLLLQPSSMSTMGEIVWQENKKVAVEVLVSGEKTAVGGLSFVTSIHLVSPFQNLEDILFTALMNNVEKQSRYTVDLKWAPERSLAVNALKRTDDHGKTEASIVIDTPFERLKHAEADSIIQVSDTEMLFRVGCQYNGIRTALGVNVNQSPTGLQGVITFSSNIPNFEAITTEFDFLTRHGDYFANAALTFNEVRSHAGYQLIFDKEGGFDTTIHLKSPFYKQLKNVKFNVIHKRTDETLQLNSLFTTDDETLMSLDAEYGDRKLTSGREADGAFALKSPYGNIGPARWDFKHENRNGFYNPQASFEYKPGKRIKIQTELSVGAQKGLGKIVIKTPFTSAETLLELNGHYALIGTRKTSDLTVKWLERKVADISVSVQGTAKQGGINVSLRTPFQGIGVLAGELMIDAKNANNKTFRAAIRQDEETYELVASSDTSKRSGNYVLDFKSSSYDLNGVKLTGFYLLGNPDKYFKVALETGEDHVILGGGFRLMSELMDSHITLNTTIRNWELLEVKANYDKRNAEKVASVRFLNGDESYGLKVRGHLLPYSGTFMANTTWLTSSYAELSGSYVFGQEGKVVEGSFKTGNLTASVKTELKSSQGSGNLKVSFKSTVPDFQEINAYTTYSNIGFRKSATVLIQKDKIKFEMSGELIRNPNSLSASMSLKTPIYGFDLINVTASHRLGYSMIRLQVSDRIFTGVLSYKLAPKVIHQNTKDTVTLTVTIDKEQYVGMATILKNVRDLEVNLLAKTPWEKFEKFGMKAVRKYGFAGIALLFRVDHNDDIYQLEWQEASEKSEYRMSAGLQFPTTNDRLKQWNMAVSTTLKFGKSPGSMRGILDRGEILYFNNTAVLNQLRSEIVIVNLPRNEIELTLKLDTLDFDGHVLVINSKYNVTTAYITIKKSVDNISVSLIGNNSWHPYFSTFTLQGNLATTDKYEVTVSGSRNSEKFACSGTLAFKEGGFEGVITSDTPGRGVKAYYIDGSHSSREGSGEFEIEVKANDDIVAVSSGSFSTEDSKKSFQLNIIGTPLGPVKISGFIRSRPSDLLVQFSATVAGEVMVDFKCYLSGGMTVPIVAKIKAYTAVGFEDVATFEMNVFVEPIAGFYIQWDLGGIVLGKINISADLNYNAKLAKLDTEVLYSGQFLQAHVRYDISDPAKGGNLTVFKNGLDILTVVLEKKLETDESSGERKQSAVFILKMAPDVVCEIKFDFSPRIFKSNLLLKNPYVTYYNIHLATVLESENGKHTARFSVHRDEDLQANLEIDIDMNEPKFRAGVVSNIKGWELAEISGRIDQSPEAKAILVGVLYQEKQSSFSALASKWETGFKAKVTFDNQLEMLTSFGAVAEFTSGDITNATFYVDVGDERIIGFSLKLIPSPEAGGIIISFMSPFEIMSESYFQFLYDFSKQDKNANLKVILNDKIIKADWYATLGIKKADSLLEVTLPHNEDEILRFFARYDVTEQMSKRGVFLIKVGNVSLVNMVGNVDFEKDGGANVSIQATTIFSGFKSLKIAGYHYVQKPGSPYELNVTANDNLLLIMRGKLRHNLPLSFDGTLSAFFPMFAIENIGARYELEKKLPYRSGFGELIWGDGQKIKVIGNVSPITINLELTTPFQTIRQLAVTGRVNSTKNALRANSTVSINGQVLSLGGDLEMKFPDYFIFDLGISTPFKNYSTFALSSFLKNKNQREVEGFLSISTPFKSVSDFKATSKFTKTKDGAVGFVELPFGKYEILTSYREDDNQKKGKVTVHTPHKGFRSITLDGYLQRDGEYRHKFEAGLQTAHGRDSVSGNVNADPNNREIVVILRSPAVKNAPFSFRGQLKTGSETYDFDASIATSSASHRFYGRFGRAKEADLLGEANIECRSSLQNSTYFSLVSDFKINKEEFVGSLVVSRKGIPTKSFTVRTKRSNNELYAQMDQSNIFPSNFRSLAIRGKFLPNTLEISFITPSKTYSIVTNHKLVANGFQGTVTIDPPILNIRAVSLDWEIRKGKRFYFDGNVVVETDIRNSIHMKAESQYDRVFGEINVQSPSTGIGTFSTTGTFLNQNRHINCSLDITVGTSVHSAALDFGFTGLQFEVTFTLDSALLPAKSMAMKYVYSNKGPILTFNVDYGASSHGFGVTLGNKDGLQSVTLILDSPLIRGGILEIDGSFSMNYGKTLKCTFVIRNDVFNHEISLKFHKEHLKWFGSLVVSSSSLGNGKTLELYGSSACERQESCEVVLGFNSSYDVHEITLSMIKGVKNVKTTVQLKSPLLREGETILIADVPKSLGNLNSRVILGLWTPSKNHTISGTIQSSSHNFTADFNITSPYTILEGANFYLSITKPLRGRQEVDAHLFAPYLFKESFQMKGAVEKVQKGYKGYLNNRFPTFGDIRTSWKFENNEWNPVVLQGNIQTPLANNSFQLMIRKGPEQIATELLLESPCLPSGSMKINVDIMKEKFQVFRINLGVELNNERFELRNTFIRNGMMDYKLEVEALTPWEVALKTKVVGIFRHNIRDLTVGIELHRDDVKKISIHGSFIQASAPSIEGTLYLNNPIDGVNDISATFRYLNDAPNANMWHVGLTKDADAYSISRRSYQTDQSNFDDWVLECGERKFEVKTSYNRSRSEDAAEIKLFSFIKQNPEYSFGFLYGKTNVSVAVNTEIIFPEVGRLFFIGSLKMEDWYNFEGRVAFGNASWEASSDGKGHWTRRFSITRQKTGKTTEFKLISDSNFEILWENTEHLNGSGQGHLQFKTPFKQLQSAAINYFRDTSSQNGHSASSLTGHLNGKQLLGLTTTSKENTHSIEILNPISPITVSYTYSKKTDGLSILGKFTLDTRRPHTSSNFAIEIYYPAGQVKNMSIEVFAPARTISISFKNDAIKNGFFRQLNLKWGPGEKDGLRFDATSTCEDEHHRNLFLVHHSSGTIKLMTNHDTSKDLNVTIGMGFDKDSNDIFLFKLQRNNGYNTDGVSRTIIMIADFPALGKGISIRGSMNRSSSQGTLLQMHSEINYGVDMAISHMTIRIPVGPSANYHFLFGARTLSGEKGFHLQSYWKQDVDSFECVISSSLEGLHHEILKRHLVLTVDKVNKTFELKCNNGDAVAEISGGLSSEELYGKMRFNNYALSTAVGIVPDQRKIALKMKSGDTKYYCTIGLENNKEIAMEVVKDSVSDKGSQFKLRTFLNQSRELVTRITWKPKFPQELKDMFDQGWKTAENIISCIILEPANVLHDMESIGSDLLNEIRKELIQDENNLRKKYPDIAAFIDWQLQMVYNFIDQYAWNMKNVLSALNNILPPTRYFEYVLHWTSDAIRNLMYSLYNAITDTFNRTSFWEFWTGAVKYTEELFVKTVCFVGRSVISGALKMSKYFAPAAYEKLKMAEEWILQAIAKVTDLEEQQLMKAFKEIASEAYDKAISEIKDHVRNITNSIFTSPKFQQFASVYEIISSFTYSVVDFLASDANLEFVIGRLVDLVKNFAVHTLRTTVIRAIPWPRIEVFDPAKGELTITQRLPLDWTSFTQLPNLQDIDFSQNMADFYQYVDESMEDIYYSYKFDSDYKNWIPPFKKRALVVGGKYFITFDGRSYKFDGPCTYLLASDFVDGNFTSVIGPGGNRKTIHVEFKDVSLNFPLTEDIDKIPTGFWNSETSIRKSGNIIFVENKRGVQIMYDTTYDIFMMEISGWYFGKTSGLFGNSDNEYHNDIIKSTGQPASYLEEFAESWNVGKSCDQGKSSEDTFMELPTLNKMCSGIFINSNSTLRSCFKKVDPMFFLSMCTVKDKGPGKNIAICQAAVAYQMMCEAKGVSVQLPQQCRACQYKDKIIDVDETILVRNDSRPSTVDVIYVVEKGCQDDNLELLKTSSFKMNSVYETKYGGINAVYRVVGYGGSQRPMAVGLRQEIQYGRQNALEAISFAAATDFNLLVPSTTKTIILLPCSSCSRKAMSNNYGKVLNELLSRNITLHIIVPQRSAIKMPGRVKDLEILGFDKDSTSMKRTSDGKFVQGNADMRRQVTVPKDLCITMSLETGGSIHRDNFPHANEKISTSDWFTDRATSLADKPCEKCKCVKSSDGSLRTICSQCTPDDKKNPTHIRMRG